jgi:hypothetical protein
LPDASCLRLSATGFSTRADRTGVEAAHVPWRPLGELLVESGVLTQDELELALEEQRLSGRRLGEVIVKQGFASGPAVTRAVAQQWGLELAPERGFGTGLWGEIERRHREKRGTLEAAPDTGDDHELIALPTGQADAEAPPPDEQHVEPEPEPEPVLSLERQLQSAYAELADLHDRLSEASGQLHEARAELAEARARLAELEQKPGARKRSPRRPKPRS